MREARERGGEAMGELKGKGEIRRGKEREGKKEGRRGSQQQSTIATIHSICLVFSNNK